MDVRYSVAVIGAGLVGSAAALTLARRGCRVVILDQGEVNRGASGRNAGSLHFQLEPRMLDRLRSEPHKLARLLPINLQAIEDWRRLPQQLQCDPEVEIRGGLIVAETEGQRELLIRKMEIEQAAGLDVRLLETAELHRMAPYLSRHIRCATYCSQEGHANSRLVASAYASAARSHGVEVRINTRVAALEPASQGWRLWLGTQPICADAVLIAAGAWSRDILRWLGVDVPLRPAGLTMMATQRPEPFIGHLVQHVERRLSLKQVRDGNVLIGGGWPALIAQDAELGESGDATIQAASMLGNAAAAHHVVPAMGQLNVIRTWTGIACVTPDHLPLLGEVAAHPGIFVATGGSSFTLGPTYARLIGELITGGSTSMPLSPYRVERFLRLPAMAVP